MHSKFACIVLSCLPMLLHAGEPLFTIQLALGETAFPEHVGWYDPPITRFVSVTNTSGVSMPVTYTIHPPYNIDPLHSTCGSTLNQGDHCQLAVVFNPSKLGHFSDKVQVCGHNGLWCSTAPSAFKITVTNNDIISTQCDTIQSRPFGSLDCAGSAAYAHNFYSLIANTLHTSEPLANQHFQYFQHTPSANETTTPCLQSHQADVDLAPEIQGGGIPLCDLMGYATSNSAEESSTSKQFPPYLTFLLGTTYPILPNTVPLDKLSELLTTFAQPAMDPSVQNLGYNGFVYFLNSYYLQQYSTPYADCGNSAVCPSLYYLPYATRDTTLQTWPPQNIHYWGMSGGGGSGAGYQIEAFKPGSATHYTLFSGGGGGGGGNTTPENVSNPPVTLINTGSGGGGGSQFANCLISNDGSLYGLGLGAGTGAGLSAIEGSNVSYHVPPATVYSFYPPLAQPLWNDHTTLTSYAAYLTYLIHTLIPALYNDGYTITITGGGGGGAGLEFLNSQGVEYQPQPLSIGYGFNFCYVFNKNQQHTATDCVSSPNADSNKSALLDNLIYKNIGAFFNQGMTLAISACPHGYSDYTCTCSFQHAYVMCELTDLLIANGFSSADIPSWLINPHCNETSSDLISRADLMDQLPPHSAPNQCKTSIQNFYQAQSNACNPPWPHASID